MVSGSLAHGIRLFASHLTVAGLVVASYAGASHDPRGFFHSGAFWTALAVCLPATLILTAFFVLRRARFIRQCTNMVQAMGEGDHGRRLWPDKGSGYEDFAHSMNSMAGSIESQLADLASEKARMEAVLDGMREGLMVLDKSGRIVGANKALDGLFQVRDRLGRTPIEVIPIPELQNACDTVLNWRDEISPAMVSIQIEPGRGRVLEVSLARVKRNHEGPSVVAVFHDLTEFKRLDKVRRDFVANVSHELRTPLTSIKGYAETLLGEKDFQAGPARRFVEVILKNANHMTKMVEELLNLARIENDRQPPRMAPVNALESFRAAMRECAALASERRITMECLIPEDGLLVLADADQLGQVFRNLLENAIKYGPMDSTVTASQQVENQTVTFKVQDMGPGVPEEERQRIFERFYRVDRPRNKGEGGTGLGLAIAKHIVERHGGRIWVESAQGLSTGAAFCFTMSAARADSVPQESENQG